MPRLPLCTRLVLLFMSRCIFYFLVYVRFAHRWLGDNTGFKLKTKASIDNIDVFKPLRLRLEDHFCVFIFALADNHSLEQIMKERFLLNNTAGKTTVA